VSIHHANDGSTVNDTGQPSDRAEIDGGTIIGVVVLLVVVPTLVGVAVETIPQLAAQSGGSWLFGLVVGLLIVGVPTAAILEEM
jgi:hypothetical protein